MTIYPKKCYLYKLYYIIDLNSRLRTWRHCANRLVALYQVGRVRGHHGGTADGDVGDSRRRRRVDQRAAVACASIAAAGVQHDYGRTGTGDAHSAGAASGGAHRTRPAVTTRVPARAFGLFATAVHMVMELLVMANTHQPR